MFKVEYNPEFTTYYITYKELDFYIIAEKLGILEWFLEIVHIHGGEVTKTGEDFFTEADAYDALEKVEETFDERFREAIKKFDGMPLKDLIRFLVVFEEEDLKKNLPEKEG